MLSTQNNQDLVALLADGIEELESHTLGLPGAVIPVNHSYINGMYVREIVIPKNTLLTSRVHKKDYVDLMINGDILVITPSGKVRLTGYNSLEGLAGRKRVGYAYEDTTWVTIHAIPEDHADENYIDTETVFSLAEYKLLKDRQNYIALIASLNMSEEEVQKQVQNTSDLCDLPDSWAINLEVRQSKIAGRGVMVKTDCHSGKLLGLARISGKRTILGRFVNHSILPNAKMKFLQNSNIALELIKDVSAGEEITTDYAHTIDGHRRFLACQ